MTPRRALLLCPASAALLLVALSGVARAQAAPSQVSSVELGVSGVLAGGTSFGTANANLIAPDGSPLALFAAESRQAAAKGIELQLAIPITRALSAEVSGAWRRATLETNISHDFEGAADVTVTEALSEYSVEGSAVWRLAQRGKLDLFVRGGAGWARELSSDTVLVQSAAVGNFGGGMKYWWQQHGRGWIKRSALRVEIRGVVRSGGITLGGSHKRFVSPAVAVGVIFGF